MSAKVLGKDRLADLVAHLARDFTVLGPTPRRSDVSFREISSAEELKLDYRTTTMPPKKFFHQKEVLLTYDSNGKFMAPELYVERPILLLGVHPCDLNAMLRQDRLFSKEYEDPYYLRRRKNSAVVALNCTEVGEDCFCASLGTGPSAEEGFDLLMTDIGDSYLIEVGSETGLSMLKGLGLREASNEHLKEKERRAKAALGKFTKIYNAEGMGDLASRSPDHAVWTLIGEKGGLAGCFACLSCGNCSLVCPTCYCFEVTDTPDLSLGRGVRGREVDSCQLLEYAEVALSGNFRADRKGRIRHWMTCKFGAAGGQLESSCVGCGRCIHSCPAHIDITEVGKSLRGER